MEQNLSDRERKQRLAVGIAFELVAALLYWRQSETAFVLIFAIAGLGFFVNYFTCFCGLKRALKSLRS